ncbi:hypothetical protein M9194_07515 [Vibrio sp. S4M6]|uniref:tetratricopeptide repeat protein n=1 Tax=Vibrio sinus TaxID=2946865 RepID=UPI00202A9A41|nr:tetratricopeptide repeat protein [Vibrio sinus]MCL9781275.1 hypothetical protein [Vibrio sinus]
MKKLSLIILLLSFSQLVYANGDRLSQYTTNIVQRANHLAKDKKYDQAIKLLNGADLTRQYDKAYVDRMLGVFYWQSNQIKLAIKSLELAVNSKVLEDSQAWKTQKMLADLLLSNHQYAKSLSYYNELSKSAPKGEDAAELWLRIAQANYQLAHWQKVLSAIQSYESLHPKKEVSPLSIKLGAQVELKSWRAAEKTAKSLVSLQPNSITWWRQLTAIQLRQNKQKQALNTLALAKLQGVKLSDKDIHLLAQLYASVGIPLRAAQTMGEISDLDSQQDLIIQQASYWQLAKEWDHAVDMWLLAAKQQPKYRWNAIQILLQQGKDKQALVELDKVTKKSQQAKVALVKAQAYYRLKNLNKALSQAKYSEKLKPSEEAKSWVSYLENIR